MTSPAYMLSTPRLPLVRDYHVLYATGAASTLRPQEDLSLAAHRVARKLAQSRYNDPECYTLIFNGAKTRRRRWPHVHIIVANSPNKKRWTMFCLALKHFLRWRRWPLLRNALPGGAT